MILEKPPLFEERREFSIVVGLLLMILLFRLFLLYGDYGDFLAKPFYYTDATVLAQHSKEKRGKSYEVLKLQSAQDKKFYTTTHLSRDLRHKILRVKMIPDNTLTFASYLGTPYIKTTLRVSGEVPITEKNRLLESIASQHQDPEIAAFYQAIFLATPIPKTLRKKISGLGVSHLVALSGFHLTILWGLVYGVLSLLYKPAQQRWFPYRFMLLDLGAATLAVLGAYLWFVEMPPSLLRSYVMLLIAWLLLLLGVELLSFEFLAFVIFLLLALFPMLTLSLSFWFSVTGVYYIYLLLHWSRVAGGLWQNKWVMSLSSIPIGIFVLMLPVVHGFFGITSGWQLLAPLLSLLFVPFYPLAMILHAIGWGALFDSGLQQLFSLPSGYREHTLTLWAVAGYGLLSLGAMRSRILFGATLTAALLYLSYLFLFVQNIA